MEEFLKQLEEIAKGDFVLGKMISCNDKINIIPVFKVKFNYTNLDSKIKGDVTGISGGVQLLPEAIIEIKENGLKVHSLKESLTDVMNAGPDLFDIVTKIWKTPKES